MLAYILRRLWQMLPTMLGVVLLVFILFNWVGGDPAYILAGKMSSAESIANIRRQLGVDQPYYVQLGIFLKQIVTFDFGQSWATGEAVSSIITSRLGPSLTVLVPLTILETLIGIALALVVAFVRGSLLDRAVMIACTVGMSISILVYIIVFQYGFAYQLGLFPVQGWGDSFWENLLRYATLPILIGLAVTIAPTLRLYRTFVLDEVNQDYVRTARAKGLGERRVMWVHVLRNAAIPIITHVMANLPALLEPAAIGLGVRAISYVTLTRHSGDEGLAFEREIAGFPEVLECYSVAGESDYILQIVAADLSVLSEQVLRRLTRIQGVGSIRSNIVLARIKSSTELPLAHLKRTATGTAARGASNSAWCAVVGAATGMAM
eukprot:gene23722-26844_t